MKPVRDAFAAVATCRCVLCTSRVCSSIRNQSSHRREVPVQRRVQGVLAGSTAVNSARANAS